MARKRPHVRVVHWNEAEMAERVARLRALGFDATGERPEPVSFLRRLPEERPAALVIDLERAPSMGRDLALAIRSRKATRDIPLVFAGGDPGKVEGVRALLPDATYTTWESIGPDLLAAIAVPPASPVVPTSALAGYSGTPLPKKLGIKPGTVLALLDAPSDFAGTLGALPEGVAVQAAIGAGTTLAIWFVRRYADLGAGIGALAQPCLVSPSPHSGERQAA
jgi:hypothetical protein